MAADAISRHFSLPGLLRQAYVDWRADHAQSMGAALAFYTIFSMAPIIVIAIAVAGLVFNEQAVRGEVFTQLRSVIGDAGATMIQQLVVSASSPRASWTATIVGVVTMLIGATTVFAELQNDLDRIWKAPPVTQSGVLAMIRTRLRSFGLVLGIGFLMLASLVLTTTFGLVGRWWAASLGGWSHIVPLVDLVATLLLSWGLFALVYKLLPSCKVTWRMCGSVRSQHRCCSHWATSPSASTWRAATSRRCSVRPDRSRWYSCGCTTRRRCSCSAQSSPMCMPCRTGRWRATPLPGMCHRRFAPEASRLSFSRRRDRRAGEALQLASQELPTGDPSSIRIQYVIRVPALRRRRDVFDELIGRFHTSASESQLGAQHLRGFARRMNAAQPNELKLAMPFDVIEQCVYFLLFAYHRGANRCHADRQREHQRHNGGDNLPSPHPHGRSMQRTGRHGVSEVTARSGSDPATLPAMAFALAWLGADIESPKRRSRWCQRIEVYPIAATNVASALLDLRAARLTQKLRRSGLTGGVRRRHCDHQPGLANFPRRCFLRTAACVTVTVHVVQRARQRSYVRSRCGARQCTGRSQEGAGDSTYRRGARRASGRSGARRTRARRLVLVATDRIEIMLAR